jgi:hypothetical protein
MTKNAESKWRALIAEQQRSGLSVREFAASRDLAATTLYWWRSELKRPRADLVPVEIVEPEPADLPGYELSVGDSMTLRIPPGFDEAELRRLVAALRC